jgi:hypothetical protein
LITPESPTAAWANIRAFLGCAETGSTSALSYVDDQVHLVPGETLTTQNDAAEIPLTPGVFVPLGDSHLCCDHLRKLDRHTDVDIEY